MIETLSDYDEELMAKYLNGIALSQKEIVDVVRKAALNLRVVPVLCGSAFKNKGVQMLLDSIVEFLPSPVDMPPVMGKAKKGGEDREVCASDDSPFVALAFKIMNDPYVGQLTYFRVYSGVLNAGSYVYNVTKDQRERIGRLLKMHADKREDIKEVRAGDIVAAVGLNSTTTGDTLCDPKFPLILESLDFPEPVIAIAIEAKQGR